MNESDDYAFTMIHEREKDELSGSRHRLLIGAIGILTPFILILIAGIRPLEELPPWKLLNSISAYYYTGAVSVFSGILIALAIFLFAYRGYSNEHWLWDRLLTFVAGVASIVVAIFPTNAPNDLLKPSWWTPITGKIHLVAAVVLFGALSINSLAQFTRTKPGHKGPLEKGKRIRNALHYFCGGSIIVCIIWSFIALISGAPIFLPEAAAFIVFGSSWVIKGRIDTTLRGAKDYLQNLPLLTRDLKRFSQNALKPPQPPQPANP